MERQIADKVESDEPVESLYAAIERSARVLDVPCSRERVMPILTVYGGALARAVVAFRVATGRDHSGELDCRFTVPLEVDPYLLAVDNGLLEKTDHPVSELLTEVRRHCAVDSYGIDFGVVGGFKKVWLVLPRGELQAVSALADIPAMPRSLGQSLDFFARYGLGDTVGLLGIDYRRRTVNVYFGEPPAGGFAPESVRSMLREVDQAEPSAQMLELGQRAFGIYVTLNWESPQVERICFAVATTDPTELAVPLDPTVERFVTHVRESEPHTRFVYAVASQPDGEYYKLQSYYRWQPEVLDIMQLSDRAVADPV
ncbi:aromatic prenyltransferase [Micromonospora sp. WMMD1120]|uniref:aromatic prenyltransferase n=1 Tax=Micromonospora sp. WMMD1120 TaxID=3016106 RepID=UPI002417BCEF|nr:aromatic prenyltransferase [Micromonospora sp. WMMD1120]MDG4809532.1 aromatic prenyltransferase [Micromonospora sp. WMMD1120]